MMKATRMPSNENNDRRHLGPNAMAPIVLNQRVSAVACQRKKNPSEKNRPDKTTPQHELNILLRES